MSEHDARTPEWREMAGNLSMTRQDARGHAERERIIALEQKMRVVAALISPHVNLHGSELSDIVRAWADELAQVAEAE